MKKLNKAAVAVALHPARQRHVREGIETDSFWRQRVAVRRVAPADRLKPDRLAVRGILEDLLLLFLVVPGAIQRRHGRAGLGGDGIGGGVRMLLLLSVFQPRGLLPLLANVENEGDAGDHDQRTDHGAGDDPFVRAIAIGVGGLRAACKICAADKWVIAAY